MKDGLWTRRKDGIFQFAQEGESMMLVEGAEDTIFLSWPAGAEWLLTKSDARTLAAILLEIAGKDEEAVITGELRVPEVDE